MNNMFKNVKIAPREKKMLIIVGVVGAILLYINFVALPQYNWIKGTIEEKNELTEKYNDIIAVSSPNSELNQTHNKLLTDKDELLKHFYPSLNEPKILEELDTVAWESGVVLYSYDATTVRITPITGQSKDKTELSTFDSMNTEASKKSESKSVISSSTTFRRMQVEIGSYTSYQGMIDFIRRLEENVRRPVISELRASPESSADEGENILNWRLTLDYYAITSPYDDEEFYSWKYKNLYGKEDPFSASEIGLGYYADVGINKDYSQQGQGEGELTKKIPNDARNYDIVLSSQPINSDKSPALIGCGNDPSASTYLFSSNDGIETASVVIKETEKNIVMTTTLGNKIKENIILNPAVSDINMAAISCRRVAADDVTGVKLSITNQTSRKMNVVIRDEDPDRPRIQIVSKSGNVNITQ